ncbi:hypothetical protein H8S95_14685 [Pontibacter sp. KCTC 32443]|uniref:hypothetical protein n=1 Tax=Pontibacter TaxID=323449 RepID=UPI00164DAF6D|nr:MULTISPECIES: hypothetical protein [Pontibacter]MBC5775323.1 hypothetical protein [Pontibacter sp. KCTC 32443]
MSTFAAVIRQSILTCSFIVLVSIASPLFAQTDTTKAQAPAPQRWLVETKDGSVYQGIFLGQDEKGIRLRTASAGEITIPMDQVKSTRILDERNFKNGEYWFENPNATRYLFGPSAYSLRKGEAYYQNTYLVLNSFNYGVTNNFTIGGGFELISTFTGEPTFFITPKYAFPIAEKWRAGAGVLYLTTTLGDDESEDDFSGMGIGYSVLTYGNTDNNATIGLGYGFVDSELADRPVITISGMTRLSRRFGLVSENWIVPEESIGGVFSYGIRHMGERITVDLAFINNREIAESIAIGIPYVDFVVKFGK